jgi:hypothetical protein
MDLNKSIIESAYQPMKRQFGICTDEKTKLLNTLNHYKALIDGIMEGLLYIDRGIGLLQDLIGGIHKSAAYASSAASEKEKLNS